MGRTDTFLEDAARCGDAVRVAALLGAGAPVDAANEHGDTPLHWAAWGGHTRVVAALLDATAPVGAANAAGNTPLHEAARCGHAGVVAALLASAAAVGLANARGHTPLHEAARSGHTAVVAALLAADAPVGAATPEGSTPLHRAAGSGHTAVVAALLTAGAPSHAVAAGRNTPLHWAAGSGHTAVVAALLAAGVPVASANGQGSTPLHMAAYRGHAEVVKALLAAAAPVGAASTLGNTPLHKAAMSGRIEVVKALLAAGGPVRAASVEGNTPLHEAARSGQRQVVAALLAAAAPVDQANANGDTPLHWAAGSGRTEVVRVLLAASASVGMSNTSEDTPLHWAASSGHADVVAALLAAAGSVGAANRSGDTPLHCAAGSGHADVVAALLAASATVDAANVHGHTPLGQVVRDVEGGNARLERKIDTIKVLCAWGAAVPASSRSVLFLSDKRKQLRALLAISPRMTERERKATKDNWRRSAAQLMSKAVMHPTAADRALDTLRATFERFGADPEKLAWGDVQQMVTGNYVKDVRCLRCAHQILVLAQDVGLFAHLTPDEVEMHRTLVYERIYVPVLHVLEPGDKNVVHAIIDSAARRGLLASHHLSSMTASLSLHEVFFCKLIKVNQRLNNLEAAADNLGEQLFHTIKGLRALLQHIKDKDEREKRVALIKSAVKLGISLVPLAGGVLGVSIDAVAAFAEGAVGANAVCQLLADPADVQAALHVFRCVWDAKESLPPEQQQALAGVLLPYKAMDAVVLDLEAAAEALGVDTGAAADALAGPAGGNVLVESLEEEAGGSETAAADEAQDEWGEFEEEAADALVEHGVDWAADRRRRRAPAPSIPAAVHPAALPCSAASQPAASPAVAPGTTVSAAAAAARATLGGGPPCAPTAVLSYPSGTALHALLPHPVVASCAAVSADGRGAEAVRVPGRARSPPSPGRGATVRARPQPASLPQPPCTAAASPSSARYSPERPHAHPPSGSDQLAGGTVIEAAHGEPQFFAGIRGWSFDVVATKLVAYVTDGYPPPARAAFEEAARAGTTRTYLSGATVVQCDDADVDQLATCLLGDAWRSRVGALAMVRAFFQDAKAADRAGQRAAPPVERQLPRA